MLQRGSLPGVPPKSYQAEPRASLAATGRVAWLPPVDSGLIVGLRQVDGMAQVRSRVREVEANAEPECEAARPLT